jgi:Flp pilus assembly protein TadD
VMNSWHSFSPNGHWLVFSSKGRSPYTRMFLTHIDGNGDDTPPIEIENATAANRAVNIPEFVNIAVDGLDKIDPQATEFYRLFDQAYKQMENNQIPEAIQSLHQAIERDPSDALSHYMLATALSGSDQEREALAEYRQACALNPQNPVFLDHLAVSLDLNGDQAGAVEKLQNAIDLAPASAEYRFNLGIVLESRGDFQGAIAPLQKSVELSRGKNWRSFAELAKAYDKTGNHVDAIRSARQALSLAEQSHDEQAAKNLRDALEGYGGKADPQ